MKDFDFDSLIIDVFPEPIIIITIAGDIKKINKSAQKWFSVSQNWKNVNLNQITLIKTPKLERLLRAWGRSGSMVQGSLPIRQQDGSYLKLPLEAVGVPFHDTVLIMLRFQINNSMLHKFISLKQRINNLHFEIANQKIVESQLALEYQQTLQNNNRLKFLAFQDELTQISNRRFFEESLERYWCEATEKKYSLALIFLDIDHFKLYNDLYGHVQGDNCLRTVAQAINNKIRGDHDIVARYGGEEFVVLSKKCNLNLVLKMVERIFSGINDLAIPHHSSPTSKILTISAGVALIEPLITMENYKILIEFADQALYQAKMEGRNRYSLFDYNYITLRSNGTFR